MGVTELINQSMSAFANRIRNAATMANETIQGDSLRSKVIRNTGWIGIGYGLEILIGFISSAILTRLLAPSDYGMIVAVMVVLTVAVMISDLGIGPIVMADERGDDKDFLGILWTLQVVRGAVLALATIGVSILWSSLIAQGQIPNASGYADPDLPRLLLLISFVLFVSGFSSLNEYRMTRHLKHGVISVMDIGTRVGSTVITVLLVFLSKSVWGMALAIVLGSALRVILTHVVLTGPRMTFRFNLGEILKVVKMSRWVAVNSTMTVITAQADKVLIGYVFGINVLGVYAIAFTLFSGATRLVNQLSTGMGVPVLRALADRPYDERKRNYYRFRIPIDLYCVLGGTCMVLIGPLFFKLVYDPRYALGGVIFALLGLKVILVPLTLSGNFLYANMQYKLMMTIGAIRSALFLGGFAIAIYLNSLTLMILVIALEKVPEIILFFTIKRAGVLFDRMRDGGILALTAVLTVYLLLMH
jgi:O-antigen/teichoic acid export membrane protein